MNESQLVATIVVTIVASAAILAGCSGGDEARTTPVNAATKPAASATTTAAGAVIVSPTVVAVTPTPTLETVSSPVTRATQAPEIQSTVPPLPTEPPLPVGGGTASLTIAAIDTKFSPSSATLLAGTFVTLTFDNQDLGVTHDIVIFDPAGATLGSSDLAEGPVVQTVTFTLGALGSYSFKCSVHPQQMRGFIAVQ